MNYEEKFSSLEEQNKELKERVEFLEFKVELLAENTKVARLLFESNITKSQYNKIMDLMDIYRYKIDNKEEVHHYSFESEIEGITGNRDYHFAEALSRAFMEDGRWDEVFPKLYGDLPKYKYFMETWKKGDI